MVLSDRSIREALASGRIRIEPCDPDDIQPSSVDLHLAASFQVFRNSRYPYIDPAMEQDGLMELVEASAGEPFVLHPGEFVLGATIERVG
jgi:dCTP deaminase